MIVVIGFLSGMTFSNMGHESRVFVRPQKHVLRVRLLISFTSDFQSLEIPQTEPSPNPHMWDTAQIVWRYY